jgi:hypothetical protein
MTYCTVCENLRLCNVSIDNLRKLFYRYYKYNADCNQRLRSPTLRSMFFTTELNQWTIWIVK